MNSESFIHRDATRGGPAGSGWRARARSAWVAGVLSCSVLALRAGLPEPDNVFFGSIVIDGSFVTAAETNVTVELRKEEEAAPILVYRMGDSSPIGDKYLVRARLESADPIVDPEATPIGGTVWLVLKQDGIEKDRKSYVLSERGAFVELNFGSADSDGDGMSDAFELAHFGSATGGDPDADPDADGRPNRREFLQGTNPLVADGRHPADIAAADDSLGIQEVTEYTLAWQTGTPWTIEPLTIPIAYVTRANLLWQSGEAYLFDNDPPTNAPNWWVSPPPLPSPASATLASETSGRPSALASQKPSGDLEGDEAETRSHRSIALASDAITESAVDSELPSTYSVGAPFLVENWVRPADAVKVYAVEDWVPDGVLVREVSDGGRFDRVNRKVKWGPFFDADPRRLTYQATPLGTAPVSVTFAGTGSFDGTDVPIGGRRLTMSDAHSTAHSPRLAIEFVSSGVRLALEGQPGQEYVIEVSKDFLTWTVVDSATADAQGSAWITGAEGPPSSGASFYRARTVPNPSP